MTRFRECGRDTVYQCSNTLKALREAVTLIEQLSLAHIAMRPLDDYVLSKMRMWREACDSAMTEIETNIAKNAVRGGLRE